MPKPSECVTDYSPRLTSALHDQAADRGRRRIKGDRPISNRGWQRESDEPIAVPDGGTLRTLRDAGDYITKLPKRQPWKP